jgi:voltage-gated potassium channel
MGAAGGRKSHSTITGAPAADSTASARLVAWRARTDWPLMALAIGTLPVLLLETQRSDLARHDQMFIDIINVVVLVAFATDYVVELLLSENRGRYVRSEWASLLIVIAQVVALVPSLAAFGALRAFRAGRLLRLVGLVVRGIALGGAAKKQGRRLLRKHAAGVAFGTAGLTWLTSAAAFVVVEDVGVGKPVDSYGDALWWALATITTVGYGDIFPVTIAGRVIGGFTMIIGISTFAVVTARVAQFLVRDDES